MPPPAGLKPREGVRRLAQSADFGSQRALSKVSQCPLA